MRKNFGILILISIIVSSIFFMSTGRKTTAEECNDCPSPTEPGDADYCSMDHPFNLSSSIDEIECGTPVILTINGGIAPFTGSVDGNGYALKKISDNEFSLSCISGCACGDGTDQAGAVATVTVTDDCGTNVTTEIRNKSGGWSGNTLTCGSYTSTTYYGDPVGQYWYNIRGNFGSGMQGWGCSDSCPSYVINNLSSLGFPNSSGDSFTCDESNRIIRTKNGVSHGYAMIGWGFAVYRRKWVCP